MASVQAKDLGGTWGNWLTYKAKAPLEGVGRGFSQGAGGGSDHLIQQPWEGKSCRRGIVSAPFQNFRVSSFSFQPSLLRLFNTFAIHLDFFFHDILYSILGSPDLLNDCFCLHTLRFTLCVVKFYGF